MEFIDLRSDTVTKPSREMREYMLTAEVGDDVYGEDPTVNRLQERVAALLGKETALFVPSGVMANQLAIKVHTQPGDEVIVESDSHIFNYETAAAAFLSNVQLCTIKGDHGIMNADSIARGIRSDVYYNPKTSLVCLENTHNKAGGTIYPIESIKEINSLARSKGLRLHLDGARLWNASVATGIPLHEYANYFDTVSICFSKGLGAPVGSALVGSLKNIESARKYRKIFGGGMRQVGILAACALYAIEHNVQRLSEDHAKAKLLADELSTISGFSIDKEYVHSNIVIIDISKRKETISEIIGLAKLNGVLLSEMSPTILRAVVHLDVSMDQVIYAARVITAALIK
jgi:threonine aldolase